MTKFNSRVRQLGQGMTEYIIIVALIAIAAIGVYKAFGGVVRGQTAAAASALSGNKPTAGKAFVQTQQTLANGQAKEKTLKTFAD